MKPGRSPVSHPCENMHINNHFTTIWLLSMKLIDAAKHFYSNKRDGTSAPSLFPKYPLMVQHTRRCQIPARFPTLPPPLYPLKAWAQNSIHSCIPVFFIKAKIKPAPKKGQRKRGRMRGEYFLCLDEKRNTMSFCCASAESVSHLWAVMNILWVKHTQQSQKERESPIYLFFIFMDN